MKIKYLLLLILCFSLLLHEIRVSYFCGSFPLMLSPKIAGTMRPYLSKSDGFELVTPHKVYLFSKEKKLRPEWFTGHNLVKDIVAYDKNSSSAKVKFLATDWNDLVGTYQLSTAVTNEDLNSFYPIIAPSNVTKQESWVYVTDFSCRVGIYSIFQLFYIMLLLITSYISIRKIRQTQCKRYID